jgi:hypothetical protein
MGATRLELTSLNIDTALVDILMGAAGFEAAISSL